jgi:hypothetical protein
MRPIVARVDSVRTTVMVRLDNYATAVLAVAIACDAGTSFTMFHTFDDPGDLVSPIAQGSMVWGNNMLPLAAQAGSTSLSFALMIAPLWMQLNYAAGPGGVRAVFLQVGDHSHSNISSGVFAPKPFLAEGLSYGNNFMAMRE